MFRRGKASTWATPLARRVRKNERTLTANLYNRPFTRRRVLLVAAVSSWIVLAESGSSAEQTRPDGSGVDGRPRRADMTIAASGDTTVICTDRTGAVSYDLASGRQLWSDSHPEGASATPMARACSRFASMVVACDRRTTDVTCGLRHRGQSGLQLATPSTVVVSRAGLLRGVDATSARRAGPTRHSGEFLGVLGAVATGQFIAYG